MKSNYINGSKNADKILIDPTVLTCVYFDYACLYVQELLLYSLMPCLGYFSSLNMLLTYCKGAVVCSSH